MQNLDNETEFLKKINNVMNFFKEFNMIFKIDDFTEENIKNIKKFNKYIFKQEFADIFNILVDIRKKHYSNYLLFLEKNTNPDIFYIDQYFCLDNIIKKLESMDLKQEEIVKHEVFRLNLTTENQTARNLREQSLLDPKLEDLSNQNIDSNYLNNGSMNTDRKVKKLKTLTTELQKILINFLKTYKNIFKIQSFVYYKGVYDFFRENEKDIKKLIEDKNKILEELYEKVDLNEAEESFLNKIRRYKEIINDFSGIVIILKSEFNIIKTTKEVFFSPYLDIYHYPFAVFNEKIESSLMEFNNYHLNNWIRNLRIFALKNWAYYINKKKDFMDFVEPFNVFNFNPYINLEDDIVFEKREFKIEIINKIKKYRENINKLLDFSEKEFNTYEKIERILNELENKLRNAQNYLIDDVSFDKHLQDLITKYKNFIEINFEEIFYQYSKAIKIKFFHQNLKEKKHLTNEFEKTTNLDDCNSETDENKESMKNLDFSDESKIVLYEIPLVKKSNNFLIKYNKFRILLLMFENKILVEIQNKIISRKTELWVEDLQRIVNDVFNERAIIKLRNEIIKLSNNISTIIEKNYIKNEELEKKYDNITLQKINNLIENNYWKEDESTLDKIAEDEKSEKEKVMSGLNDSLGSSTNITNNTKNQVDINHLDDKRLNKQSKNNQETSSSKSTTGINCHHFYFDFYRNLKKSVELNNENLNHQHNLHIFFNQFESSSHLLENEKYNKLFKISFNYHKKFKLKFNYLNFYFRFFMLNNRERNKPKINSFPNIKQINPKTYHELFEKELENLIILSIPSIFHDYHIGHKILKNLIMIIRNTQISTTARNNIRLLEYLIDIGEALNQIAPLQAENLLDRNLDNNVIINSKYLSFLMEQIGKFIEGKLKGKQAELIKDQKALIQRMELLNEAAEIFISLKNAIVIELDNIIKTVESSQDKMDKAEIRLSKRYANILKFLLYETIIQEQIHTAWRDFSYYLDNDGKNNLTINNKNIKKIYKAVMGFYNLAIIYSESNTKKTRMYYAKALMFYNILEYQKAHLNILEHGLNLNKIIEIKNNIESAKLFFELYGAVKYINYCNALIKICDIDILILKDLEKITRNNLSLLMNNNSENNIKDIYEEDKELKYKETFFPYSKFIKELNLFLPKIKDNYEKILESIKKSKELIEKNVDKNDNKQVTIKNGQFTINESPLFEDNMVKESLENEIFNIVKEKDELIDSKKNITLLFNRSFKNGFFSKGIINGYRLLIKIADELQHLYEFKENILDLMLAGKEIEVDKNQILRNNTFKNQAGIGEILDLIFEIYRDLIVHWANISSRHYELIRIQENLKHNMKYSNIQNINDDNSKEKELELLVTRAITSLGKYEEMFGTNKFKNIKEIVLQFRFYLKIQKIFFILLIRRNIENLDNTLKNTLIEIISLLRKNPDFIRENNIVKVFLDYISAKFNIKLILEENLYKEEENKEKKEDKEKKIKPDETYWQNNINVMIAQFRNINMEELNFLNIFGDNFIIHLLLLISSFPKIKFGFETRTSPKLLNYKNYQNFILQPNYYSFIIDFNANDFSGNYIFQDIFIHNENIEQYNIKTLPYGKYNEYKKITNYYWRGIFSNEKNKQEWPKILLIELANAKFRKKIILNIIIRLVNLENPSDLLTWIGKVEIINRKEPDPKNLYYLYSQIDGFAFFTNASAITFGIKNYIDKENYSSDNESIINNLSGAITGAKVFVEKAVLPPEFKVVFLKEKKDFQFDKFYNFTNLLNQVKDKEISEKIKKRIKMVEKYIKNKNNIDLDDEYAYLTEFYIPNIKNSYQIIIYHPSRSLYQLDIIPSTFLTFRKKQNLNIKKEILPKLRSFYSILLKNDFEFNEKIKYQHKLKEKLRDYLFKYLYLDYSFRHVIANRKNNEKLLINEDKETIDFIEKLIQSKFANSEYFNISEVIEYFEEELEMDYLEITKLIIKLKETGAIFPIEFKERSD